jgi:hypothetical protein
MLVYQRVTVIDIRMLKYSSIFPWRDGPNHDLVYITPLLGV